MKILKHLRGSGDAGLTGQASQMEGLDLPLHLFQVLEEEHVSLYGQLEQETIITLNGRSVTSSLDWDFHQGHIKDWEQFKRHLQNPDPSLPLTFKNLLNGQNVPNWRSESDALESLNELLGEDFYSQADFKHLHFGHNTEKLLELYSMKASFPGISDEELREINRLLLDELFPKYLESVREIRLAAIYERQHERKSASLCFSGGGIRSGTLALGLLQGLARHNLLKQFDYLSTVSGGGYIGGWLTAWIHRHPRPDTGLVGVTNALTNASPGSKVDPDPAAIRHLREYSNFLTPRPGLISTDTWTFVAIYVRNLLLNWSVIIPLILAFLLIPRFSVSAVLAVPTQPIIQSFDINLRHLFLLGGFISAAWAIAYMGFSRPGLRTRLIERNPRWKDHMGQRGFLRFCLAPLVIAAVLLTTYSAWTHNEKRLWHFMLFGLFTALVGLLWSAYILRGWRDWREIRIFGPLLVITAGAIGGLLVALGRQRVGSAFTTLNVDHKWATELYVSSAVPLFMLMFLLAVTVFAGISSHFLSKVTDEDREWWARFSAWTLISALTWAVFSSLVIFGPLALLASPRIFGSVGGLAGLVALLLGRSEKTPATSEKVERDSLVTKLSSKMLPLLALVFIAVFVAALSLATTKLTVPASNALQAVLSGRLLEQLGYKAPVGLAVDKLYNAPFEGVTSKAFRDSHQVKLGENWVPGYVEHMRAIHYPRWWFFLFFMIGLTGIGLSLARVINLNLFSLHGAYRNRLIRGFLAASRDKRLRRPNPFTGFDPADNVSMHELRPALLHEVDFQDLDGFANQLKMGGEALKSRTAQNSPGDVTTASEFLYGQLSDQGKAAVEGCEPPIPLSQGQRITLIEDLNRILESREIQLGMQPGFLLPSSAQEPQGPQPTSQRREYHIHRNRQALEQTFPQFIIPSNYPPHRLLHVVNTTLNLVGGDNLAWQHRKAESFTISPLHCGSYRVGYRRSKDYGGDDGISLGTAMAISGAAASSNMGYYTTSPVLSLVMTLFNVRLGWWLGNPGPAGSHAYSGIQTDDLPGKTSKRIYRRMAPTFSIKPVFNEAFGLTDDRNEYVYLTDGGHFENLALYEMVLRRCHLIVVSDGAADPNYEFNDLANAVRKIRIDLGIHIEFPDVPIFQKAPDKEGVGGCYWTIGLIRYSDMDRRPDRTKAPDGILIYIKPAVYGTEPEDVAHYKCTHPDFPNETTADQFFDEPQFESYRALGSYMMREMCGSRSGDMTLVEFVAQANKNFLRLAPQVRNKYAEFWQRKI